MRSLTMKTSGLMVFLILLMACQPVVIQQPVTVAPIIITATFAAATPETVTAQPVTTPTQEILWPTTTPMAWDISCLPPGILPLNTNPCPTTDLRDMVFVSRPNGNWGTHTTTINCESGKCVIDLHGGAGFAGAAGVEVHNITLDAGKTYAINFNGAINLTDGDARDNYSAGLRIYKDDGSSVTLRNHSVEVYNPQTQGWQFTGDRNFFWCITAYAPTTIAFEATIQAVWAMAHPGNYFAIDGIYIYAVDNINVCNEVMGIR